MSYIVFKKEIRIYTFVLFQSNRYFQGKFWVLDEILRITENTVFWVEQKTEHAVSSYKLDNYLKKIDTAASDIVSKVEYTVPDVVKKVQNTASDVVTKVQDTASNVKNVVEDSRQKLIKSGKGL